MDKVHAKNAPSFGGWFIAAGAAAVAFGVAIVLFEFSVPQASLVAGVLFVAVGLILGQPDRPMPAMRGGDVPWPVAAPAAAPVATLVAAPVATLVAAPVAALVAAPVAPLIAAPVAAPGTAPVATLVAAPVMSAPVMGKRPEGLAVARGGRADDLKLIKGIGLALEKLCHSLGYYHFDQIAQWTSQEIAWVDNNLEEFRGSVTRDEWVAQAKVLAARGTV